MNFDDIVVPIEEPEHSTQTNSSRFAHFNEAVYSGSTNREDSENQLGINDTMVITAGMCFRSQNYEGGNPRVHGSFVTVTVDQQGHYSDIATTAVRYHDGDSRVCNVPLAQEEDNIGHVTIDMKNNNQNMKSQMQKETNNYYERYKLPITLPIGNPYIVYSEDLKVPDSICSYCIIL